MNFGRGQYVGLLLSDTELGSDYNRVIGGDAAFKTGEHFQGKRVISLHAFAVAPAVQRARGNGGQAVLRLQHAAALRSPDRLEHYDRGFRMDTAFINRVGADPGLAVSGAEFLPVASALSLDQADQPVLLDDQGAEDRMQGGTEVFYLPARPIQFHARQAICDWTTAPATRRLPDAEFEIGRMMVDGGAQFTRWLNIGGSAQKGPSIFYDPEAPFQGYRRSANLRSACSRIRASTATPRTAS